MLLVGLITVCLLGAMVLTSPEQVAADDFVQYWAAGRSNLSGNNPYDADQLQPWQHAAGRHSYIVGVVTIAWNPPWTFPLFMAYGALPYVWGRVLWFLTSFAIIAFSAAWMWRTYGGAPRQVGVSLLLALTFVPTLVVLQVGQLGPFVLIALVGLLAAVKAQRWGWAGACAALLTVKPQLLHVALLAMLLWVVSERRASVALGGVAGLGVLLGLAMLPNGEIVPQYLEAIRDRPPVEWATPTIGGVLRLLAGTQRFWLQLVPMFAGYAWLIVHWWRWRNDWRWVEETPDLVIVSMLTAPYLWTYDMVVLLVPLLHLTPRITHSRLRAVRGPVLSYLVLLLLMVAQQLAVLNEFWSFWFVPTFAVWYFSSRQRLRLADSRRVTL